jgi:cbb3-type cytochrome oxidase maturation protein
VYKRQRGLGDVYKRQTMDSLYLLIPLSVLLVLAILVGLWWAVDRGQFEDLEQEAERILRDD